MNTKDILKNILIMFIITFSALSMPVEASGPKIITMAAGGHNSAILLDNGSVWAWGLNRQGSCGYNDSDNMTYVLSPNRILIENVTDISAGGTFFMALKNDGTVYTWGGNDFGQLGTGYLDIDNHPLPVIVEGLSNVTAISAGHNFALALRDDGTIWAWGSNSFGLLGDGMPVDHAYNDTQDVISYYPYNDWFMMFPAGVNLSEINVSQYMPSNISNSDKKWNPVPSHNSTPNKVIGLENVKLISGNFDTCIAVDDKNTIWGWGNFNINKSTAQGATYPVPLCKSDQNITSISDRLVLTDDGTVYVVTFNTTKKQLDRKGSPYNLEEVKGLTNITKISFGMRHGVALKEDGTVWTWGENYRGELGDGTDVKIRLEPKKVRGLPFITDIATKNQYTLALSENGTIFGWGSDCCGELGDMCYGDNLYRNTPVKAQFSESKEDIVPQIEENSSGDFSKDKNNETDHFKNGITLAILALAIIIGGLCYSRISKK